MAAESARSETDGNKKEYVATVAQNYDHPLHISHRRSRSETVEGDEQTGGKRLRREEDVDYGSCTQEECISGGEVAHPSLPDQGIPAVDGAASMGKTEDAPIVEDIQSTITRIQQEANEFYTKWINPFSESEAFELFCPTRLDELLKEAYALENNMKQQKEKLKARLKQLSRTLDMMETSP